MNKYKQKILMYAEVSRKFSDVQNTYIEYITEELNKLYPDLILSNSNDTYFDWACDITNCSSNQDVIETLIRMENILLERKHEKEISDHDRLKIKIKELENYINKLEHQIKDLT